MGNQAELDPRSNEAISAALENNWEKALQLNEDLLKKYPEDTDTMNRLARALSETGNLSGAKKFYKKVLELDPYNTIAEKNLNRLSTLKKGTQINGKNAQPVKGDTFLEEPGKTIILPLTDTAMPQVLADLQVDDQVQLEAHRSDVTATSSNGKRIGKIEPEISKVISKDLHAGSKFEAFIKSVTVNAGSEKGKKSQVSIFIRETSRSEKVSHAPFPTNSQAAFTPFVRDEALNLANQAPVPVETDGSIEEVEVSEIQEVGQEQSLEGLAEKEHEENEEFNE
jgi:hypothetical protein